VLRASETARARSGGNEMRNFVQARIGMRARNNQRVLAPVLLSAALGLTACMSAKMEMPMMASVPLPVPMSMPEVVAPPPPSPPQPVAPQATPGLGARERFQLALNLLQQGDSMRADVELKAYLMDVPNSAPAKSLIGQIDTARYALSGRILHSSARPERNIVVARRGLSRRRTRLLWACSLQQYRNSFARRGWPDRSDSADAGNPRRANGAHVGAAEPTSERDARAETHSSCDHAPSRADTATCCASATAYASGSSAARSLARNPRERRGRAIRRCNP